MTIDNALLWQKGFATDDKLGQAAQARARKNFGRLGEAAHAAPWQAAGEALQTFQTINCYGAHC